MENGFKNIEIKTVLSPAWTTDWMTEAGKQKLKAYGIAPPNPKQIVCTTDAFRKKKPYNARIAIHIIHNSLVALVLLPAKHYINATIAKNLLIILNAIDIYLD